MTARSTRSSPRPPSELPRRDQGPSAALPLLDAAPALRYAIDPALMNRAAGVLALVTMVLAALALIGWSLGIEVLTSFAPGLATMKFNTALGLLVAAAAGWALRSSPRPRLSALLAAFLGLLAGLTLVEYATQLDLGIDQLLVRDPAPPAPGDAPGRMSSATALGLSLMALAIFALDRWPVLSHLAALAAGVIAFLAVASYAYGVEALYSVRIFSSFSLPTTLAFLALSVGLILARPTEGFVAFALRVGSGPSVVRRVMPWAFAIPFITGLTRIAVERSAAVPSAVATAIFVLTDIGLLLVIVGWTARVLDRGEAQLLRLSERDRLYSAIVQSTCDAVVVADLEGAVRGWNAAAERLYERPAEEAKGEHLEAIFAAHLHSEAHDRLRRAGRAETVEPWLTRGRARSGRLFDASMSISPVRDPAGAIVAVAVLARDVTAQRVAEERFRVVVEGSPNGMLLIDGAGTIVFANGEAGRLFGQPAAALVGTPAEAHVPSLRQPSPDGGPAPAEAPPPGSGRRELLGVRADGLEFPVEVGLSPLETAEGRATLATLVDITERKAREMELLRSNAELEQFAYVASHDLQEPLRMVSSYTELLAQRYKGELDARADKYIYYAVDGAKRMQRLVADLLAFSRVGSQGKPLVPVDADQALRAVRRSLKAQIIAAEATVEAPEALPTVNADEGQLRQLLQNLISNAIKFRAERPPKIVVRASAEGQQWVFSVADNGIGIDAAYHERVFQMFQRLHARGTFEGSGIGLAIAKRIVERHGGTIWIESAPGEGSTFFFTLSAASPSPAPEASGSPTPPPSRA